jgi:hypothetical protein
MYARHDRGPFLNFDNDEFLPHPLCTPPAHSIRFHSVFCNLTGHKFLNASSDSLHIEKNMAAPLDENSGEGFVRKLDPAG